MFRHICIQFDMFVDSFQYRAMIVIILLHNNHITKYQYSPSLVAIVIMQVYEISRSPKNCTEPVLKYSPNLKVAVIHSSQSRKISCVDALELFLQSCLHLFCAFDLYSSFKLENFYVNILP